MSSKTLEGLWPDIALVFSFLMDGTPFEALPRADAIFVFGNYNPDVAHHAAKLWRAGKAPVIIVTGKGGFRLPESCETEAEFFASLMESDGVPKDAMILERNATNTLENVLLGMSAARAVGCSPTSVILCAIPPLLKRATATFRKQFPGVEVSGSAFPLAHEWFTARRINRFVAELNRLRVYAEQGDIVEVAIPDDVLEAEERIRSAKLQ